jgi:hypothetical protein
MKKLIFIIFIFIASRSLGQVPNNRQDRLTNDEFKDLLEYKDLFVPADLKNDTVIIVQYSRQQLSSMILAAKKLSFSENGTDTVGLGDQTDSKWIQKLSTKNPKGLKKYLEKKGIECMIIREDNLQGQERFSRKYWLKSTFVSDQKSLEHQEWVLMYTYFFYDPRNNKNYETFLPVNHFLLEMIK